jgi:hypothetical protein
MADIHNCHEQKRSGNSRPEFALLDAISKLQVAKPVEQDAFHPKERRRLN